MEAERAKLDPAVFAATEELRRKLRLVRNTIQNREKIIQAKEWIYLQLGDRAVWSDRMAALENHIEAARMEIALFRRREQEILLILGNYPEAYRDENAHLLDFIGHGIQDC